MCVCVCVRVRTCVCVHVLKLMTCTEEAWEQYSVLLIPLIQY